MVLMMVGSSCWAMNRKTQMKEMHGQKQEHPMQEWADGKTTGQEMNPLGYSESSPTNHHSIPRQQFGNWNNGPSHGAGGDGDNAGNDGGSTN